MNAKLNVIDTFLRHTVTILGINYSSWKIVMDLQILKKKDSFHVDTMRCIQLMDAEFNMMNKHFGRCTLAHTEKAKAISPNQYGRRKHHKVSNAVLNKVLYNNILRQNG